MICNTPKELLAEIKKIMDIKDIPMKDLAARMKTSQQNISKIFSQSNPKLETFYRICNALDLQLDINFLNNKDDTH